MARSIDPRHAAVVAALMAAACAPQVDCTDGTPAQAERVVGGNPFGIVAPQLVDQVTGFDKGFGIAVGERGFHFGTGDRAGLGGVFINAVRVNDEMQPLAEAGPARDAQASALGITPAQFEFLLSRGDEHLAVLNAEFFAAGGEPRFQRDTIVSRTVLAGIVEAQNDAWRDGFTGTPAIAAGPRVCTPGGDGRLPFADGGGAPDGSSDTPREPSKFPWWLVALGAGAFALLALRKEQPRSSIPVAAPVKVKAPSHRFEVLGSINEAGKEVIICRNTGTDRRKDGSDAIWVFERRPEANEPKAHDKSSLVSNDTPVRTTRQGKFRVKERTVISVTNRDIREVERLEQDDFKVTTGNDELARRALAALAAGTTDDERRAKVAAVTNGVTEEGQEALRFKKSGKTYGNLFGRRIVKTKKVAKALVEAAQTQPQDTARNDALLTLQGAVLKRGPLPV